MSQQKPSYEELEKQVRELQQSRAKIERNEKLFKAIYNQAPAGIAVNDSRTGKFLHINETYCKIVGYKNEEMLAIDFMQITHPDDLQEDLDNMERLRAGEIDCFKMEKCFINNNRQIVWRSPRHDQIFGYEKPLSEWTYDIFLEHVVEKDRQMVEQKFGKAPGN